MRPPRVRDCLLTACTASGLHYRLLCICAEMKETLWAHVQAIIVNVLHFHSSYAIDEFALLFSSSSFCLEIVEDLAGKRVVLVGV